MTLPLSWQATQWEALTRRQRAGSLPHALLFHGPRGLGKRLLAMHLAHYLLCQDPGDSQPCGACAGCKLVAAGNHPDIYQLLPEADKKGISIDQVRELIEWQGIMAHRGGYKVVIVDNANLLNRNGANALLKTLEEPASKTVIVLVSENPGGLLATIRSRVQRVGFSAPAKKDGIEYLEKQGIDKETSETLLRLAQGAPLAAKALAAGDLLQKRRDFFTDILELAHGGADPVGVAHRWDKEDRATLWRWLDSCCSDLIRLKIQGQLSLLHNSDMTAELGRIAAGPGIRALYRLQDRILQGLRVADHPLNAQLQLEDMLLHWHRVFSRAG